VGDQETGAVEGELWYAPAVELQRALALSDPELRHGAVAALNRLNVLYMVARAGSGHLGSSFSSLDIVTWVHLEVLGPDDVYFSSKGHDVPGLYAMLIALGRLPFDQVHALRRRGGLPGHPDTATPGIPMNTGSLGMGISKAKGIVLGNRLRGRSGRVVVMTGDGELQEGQIWESLASAVAHRMHELTVVVDHNKLQSDTWVGDVSDLGDLEAKLAAFGWEVRRCDGHDAGALAKAFEPSDGPVAIIADTVKGRGVSFMEATDLPRGALYQYHSGAPSAADYARALDELRGRVDELLATAGATAVALERVIIAPRSGPPANATQLIAAYGDAIVDLAAHDERVVALDGDLVKDVGLLGFRDRFPDRFFECGIAEQDMVSTAGGLARQGLLPFVHSFGSFLSSRPNEQLYNNASEGRKVVYVGSLSGVVPGAPGHSHQAVRDVSAVGAIPDLVVVQPADAAQVRRALDLCTSIDESVYLRLVSVPTELPALPDEPLVVGRGHVIRGGATGIVVLAAGPTVLAAVLGAVERGADVTVVNHPFPNRVDRTWLAELLDGVEHVVTVDDHLLDGALGSLIGTAMAEIGTQARLHRRGVDGIPAFGTPDEVLAAHGLDAASLAADIAALTG
jgi:transketolase